MQEETAAARGAALMRTMLGDELVDRIAARNTIAPLWQRLTTEVLFGDNWSRDVLPLRLRSMLTVGVLVSMSRPRELENHMRAALINGVTPSELVEIVQHVGFYAGWPSVGEGLTVLRRVLEDHGALDESGVIKSAADAKSQV